MAGVGSCCLLGAIAGDTLYVANLGDSRAVLGRCVVGGGVAVAERLSTDHNLTSEEVRKEVSSQNPDDGQIVVHTRGAWRIKGIIQGPHSRDEALSTTSSEGSGVKAKGGPTEPASVPKA